MTILLTGFEPFGGGDRNPASEAVSQVGLDYAGAGKLITHVLRTEFAGGGDRLVELLQQHRPDAWIGIGLNHRATGIALERVAFNVDDARIADNAGNLRQNAVISPDGPATLNSTLPLEKIHNALSSAGLWTIFSDSAGRFVCNHVFYRGCRWAHQHALPTKAGFIHVPWPKDWSPLVPASVLTFEQIVAAVKLSVQVVESDQNVPLPV